MNYLRNRALWIGVFGFLAWIFSASVSAGCIGSGASSEVVTEYGGSTLSCPTGYTGTTIDDIFLGAKSTPILNDNPNNGDGSMTVIEITGIDPTDGKVSWQAINIPTQGMPTLEDTYGMDAVISDVATGANGCFLGYGTDQFDGAVGFVRDNGNPLTTRALSFCTDEKIEVTAVAQPLAEVKECVIEGNGGQSQSIWGVEFMCANVPDDTTRTIIITADDEPDFGFTAEGNDTGVLDFNNVCQCKGEITNTGEFEVTAEECDPNPDSENPCLDETPVNAPSIVITIQQPKCFVVGGFQRCF